MSQFKNSGNIYSKDKASAKANALAAEKEANEKRKNAAIAKAAEAVSEVAEATENEENNETEA